MQWMTMTSVVLCHSFHAPQHAVALPIRPLNHSNDFLRPSCRNRLYITGTGKSRYAGFCLELPTPRWIADQGLRASSTLDIVTQIQLTVYRSSNLSVLCSQSTPLLNYYSTVSIEPPY